MIEKKFFVWFLHHLVAVNSNSVLQCGLGCRKAPAGQFSFKSSTILLTTVWPCCLSKQLSITVITHIFCLMLLLFSPRFFFLSVFSLSLFPVKLRRSELTTRGTEVFRREEVRTTPSPITALLIQLIQRCGASPHPRKGILENPWPTKKAAWTLVVFDIIYCVCIDSSDWLTQK